MKTPVQTRRDGVTLVCPKCSTLEQRQAIEDYVSQKCPSCVAEEIRQRNAKRRAMLIVNNSVSTYR